MKYLVYMSTPVKVFNNAELKQLLQESQANNLVHDVTGMLLYCTGSFVQAVEGADYKIDRLYNNLLKDTRHKNLIKLVEGKLKARVFPHWTMGFKTCTIQEFSKFDAFVNPKESMIWNYEEHHPAIAILKTFAETNDL